MYIETYHWFEHIQITVTNEITRYIAIFIKKKKIIIANIKNINIQFNIFYDIYFYNLLSVNSVV